ncbi:hypothetical protein QT17_11795 [Thermus sp. 2.9]|nr:hypothetical protein [Thermus sp. 2.9]KHG64523.1 hypothetical protein QT17_11795 [Thermus sp. 2.9]
MTQAQAFARRVRRLALNRQATEAQVFLERGFLYLRADGFARFAQGEGAEGLSDFALPGEGGGAPLPRRERPFSLLPPRKASEAGNALLLVRLAHRRRGAATPDEARQH